jgi:CheY-like chemotaxis protein
MFEVDYDVVGVASDGLQAVTIARLHRPDFVVLDYLMPVMDGAEAAAGIREFLPATGIVAFSAVLDHKPEWADAHLNKARVSEVAPLISQMLEALVDDEHG